MSYALNVRFEIAISGHPVTVAAVELGRYTSFDSACADRDEFAAATQPLLVTKLRSVLEEYYHVPVGTRYEVTAPPPSKMGLLIG